MKNIQLCAFADEADSTLDGQINAMLANGINGLEIRGVDGENISEISEQKAKEIRKKLDENGLFVWSIGSPSGKIGIDDNFISHLDEFKRILNLADILGAKTYRLFSFYMPKNHKPEQYKNKVLEQLNAFCEAANGSGITLCHENEKGIYGDNAKRCLEIHENIPQLKAVFDPANFVQCGQDTIEAFEMLSNYVYYMHIKDSLENGEIVPPGEGIGHLKNLTKLYKGNVYTLEPHLFEFWGLKNLEQSGDKSIVGNSGFSTTARQAFDLACNTFKTLLKGNK